MKRAFPETGVRGTLRATPADFTVDEVLGFEPDGAGEFFLVLVEKTGANTEWVGRQLAKELQLPRASVSHSGLKDRRAVARQWFSVHWPRNPAPEWSVLANEEFRVIDARRHGRKLRVGSHRANRFSLRLTNLSGSPSALVDRADQLRGAGFPNYFGPQRFGRDGRNVARAESVLIDGARLRRRSEKGRVMSTARSYLFNQWLEERVASDDWDTGRVGDYLVLNGTRSFFGPVQDLSAEAPRLAALDLHPGGPLAGRPGKASDWSDGELGFRDRHSAWVEGLCRMGARLDRRASRVAVTDLDVQWADDSAKVTVTLPRGVFATALLNELGDFTDAARADHDRQR